jgi:hypothetical protein
MSVRRIVPDIKSKDLDASRRFYVDRFFVIDPSGTIINVMCHVGEPHETTGAVKTPRDRDTLCHPTQ